MHHLAASVGHRMMATNDWLASAALAGVGVLTATSGNIITGFDWPAVDIVPLVQSMLGEHVPATDFFTLASLAPNPRQVFASLVTVLSYLLGGSLGAALVALKMLVVVCQVPLLYLLVVRCIDRWAEPSTSARLVTFVGSLTLLALPEVGHWISVAWWPPLQMKATPQSVSLVLASAGAVLALGNGARRFFAPICFAAAAAIHPVVALMMITFLGLGIPWLTLANPVIISSAVLVVSVGLLLSIAYRPSEVLSAAEFVDIYARLAHPSHYIPSEFGSLTSTHWSLPFMTVIACLLWVAVSLPENRSLGLKAALSAAAYAGSVGMQFLFVEVWPIKLIATIGPSRFTQFGYWFLILFVGAAVSIKAPIRLCRISPRFVWIVSAAFALVMVGGLWRISAGWRDGYPTDTNERELVTWLGTNTPVDAVIAGNFGTLSIRLASNRAVFAGFGFPFAEQSFREYRARTEALFGTRRQQTTAQGGWVGEQMANVFRQLEPDDFVAMSKIFRLDYVVVEASHASAFTGIPAQFSNSSAVVFKLDDFAPKIRPPMALP